MIHKEVISKMLLFVVGRANLSRLSLRNLCNWVVISGTVIIAVAFFTTPEVFILVQASSTILTDVV